MKYVRLLWNLCQLKRNEQKSREQIRALQDKKLRKLLRYAYRHSRYYRQAFEEAGITKENLSSLPLSAFPTLDKDKLMEHFEDLVTEPDLTQEALRRFDEKADMEEKTFQGRYHVVHSSGSTGIPRYFVYDEKAWEQMLLGIIRGALWDMGMMDILRLLGSGLRILYIAATDGRYGGAMAVGDGISGIGAKQMFLDIKTPLSQWIKKIKEFQPNFVIGYPSAIKILGELVERGEVEVHAYRVISCGEPLSSGLRVYLEKVFGAVTVNFYGSSESLAMGVEIDREEGMYLFDDMNYIEVCDGQMYLTSLYNFVQPLIRYRVSDQLILKESKDAAYPFRRTEIVLGRNEDILWFEDHKGKKEFLHPLAIEGFCIEGLLDYQFRQTDLDAFEMLAQISSEDRKEDIRTKMLSQMKKILQEKHLGYVRFFVTFVDEILPDPKTGKKQLIIKCQESLCSIEDFKKRKGKAG